MDHIIDLDKNQEMLERLFKKIVSGNVVLFLGAGASVTDKRYLSKELIDYYEAAEGVQYGIDNITEFVDALSADSTFSRVNFDSMVTDALRNLKVQDAHKTIASIPWREIITTNYDLLIEKANEEVLRDSNDIKEILPIRSRKQYNKFCGNDLIKYVKLNGCISDRSEYPLVFSTKDFENVKPFYKEVINRLKNPSPNIEFLFVGYSFLDPFAQQFFTKFDVGREKRWIYCIDPYVKDVKLPYYKENKISIIKTTSDIFFKKYRDWIEKNAQLKSIAFKAVQLKDSQQNPISIPFQLRQKFHNVIEQLNNDFKGHHIEPKDFYLGEEPNYNVITKGYDVVKIAKIDEAKKTIIKIINDNEKVLIPIIFLEGSFGTGKTTFTYRLIHELINNTENFNAIAFEIKDFDNFKGKDFSTLVRAVNCEYIILYSNYTEQDSVYKSLTQLRAQLSMRQDSIRYVFIHSIRENISSVFKQRIPQENVFSINIDVPLNLDESTDLVEKLENTGLLTWRDIGEKRQIINTIYESYDGDSFLSLLGLIDNGRHIEDLKDAYYQLSEECKKAFLYTALVHRYNLFMPASLLKDLVSRDWDNFMDNVVKVEGKGILIQEDVDSNGLDPDLYFKTKHSLVAEKLITEIIPQKQKRYEHYRTLFAKMYDGNCKIAINLLKCLSQNEELTNDQINKLYDLAYQNMSENPYYILRYAINLQYRDNKTDTERAIKYLLYAEGLLDKKDHKFMHRRGVLNAKLARLCSREGNVNKAMEYINEAKELFWAKQTYDPCSHYSYFDLLELLLWELENIKLTKEEQLVVQIQIDMQFEQACKSVTEGIDRIISLYDKRRKNISNNSTGHISFLMDAYEDSQLRPYACILLYNYYSHTNEYTKMASLIDELENYSDNDEVVRFLFKYYGNRLNYVDYRIKFFDLVRRVEYLQDTLMYNYYMYVAESYNSNFYDGRTYLSNIEKKYLFLNPEYQQEWKESDSENRKLFEGTIKRNEKGHCMFKATDLQQPFYIIGGKNRFPNGEQVKANLVFMLYGIHAIIVE